MAEKKQRADSYTFLYNGQAWFFKISTLEELNDYLNMIWDIRHDDLLRDSDRIAKKIHPTSELLDVCDMFAKIKGTSILGEFQRLKEQQKMEMTQMITDGETLYVNPRGGYCHKIDRVLNRYDSKELRWPVFEESDVRVKKWPGGTHFYAYIGPVQVKDGDVIKWNSESDARMAAMTYVTKYKHKEAH